MSKQNIFILSGEIHSGKTTAISNWIKGRDDVFGILTPDINGKRYFVDVHTNEQFEMQASSNTNTFYIGKYNFSQAAFEKASFILRNALIQNKGWLLVDEIGPLELKKQGFYDVVKDIIADENVQLKKLLVIRKSLVDEVVSFFKIKNYTIVTAPLTI